MAHMGARSLCFKEAAKSHWRESFLCGARRGNSRVLESFTKACHPGHVLAIDHAQPGHDKTRNAAPGLLASCGLVPVSVAVVL